MSYISYATKIVCGISDGKVVAPGEYWTAVNVHNPSTKQVTLKKRVIVALPGEKAGPITEFFEAKLDPDQALEIDRDDIFVHAKKLEVGKFIKGFVAIYCKSELDVVAVYTVLAKGGNVSFHTERVPMRKLTTELPDPTHK
jgi:hypothetical protein